MQENKNLAFLLRETPVAQTLEGKSERTESGMKIRGKITLFSAILVCVIIAGMTGVLIWVQQRALRKDFSDRITALINGIERIASESITFRDDTMLLSYLKHLMKEYPELEVALVSRKGHTSILGEVKTKLIYRTIVVAGRKGADYKPVKMTEKTSRSFLQRKYAGRRNPLPPDVLHVQIGLSKTLLDRQVKMASLAMVSKVLIVAAAALIFGFLGSWWISCKIAGPITSLVAQIQGIAEGKKLSTVKIQGDEIAYLKKQFGRMTAKIIEFIKFKEELLMTLTHEMNNPLTSIKALLGFLQDKNSVPDPRDREETYEIMADAVNTMELSLTNALALFKIGEGPVLKIQRVRLNDIINQVFRLFSPMAHSGRIQFEKPNLSDSIYIDADEELIRRIIINLVSNACKYTPAGGRVWVEVSDSPEGVNISVGDTGMGIPEKDRELIFTKFYRSSDDGVKRKIPGTGLGLAITKQAVELHNGKIWVESARDLPGKVSAKTGKGSVFHVFLPKKFTPPENSRNFHRGYEISDPRFSGLTKIG